MSFCATPQPRVRAIAARLAGRFDAAAVRLELQQLIASFAEEGGLSKRMARAPLR